LDTLLNPRVIVEVLSRSTERYDKSEKFENYESIPSLREYLLIRQDRMRVEHYVRQEGAGEWLLKSITDPAASVCFPSLGCEVPLAEIYLNVSLPPQHFSLHAGDDAATL
jgi:Uma2 family endonuclease